MPYLPGVEHSSASNAPAPGSTTPPGPEPIDWAGPSSAGKVFLSGVFLVACVAGAKFLLHLATSGGYGYFRDEFYFIDAGKHLALGYVDFPPLVAVLAAGVRMTLGDSLVAVRLLPAVAGGLVVFLTGLMARSMGAGRLGQVTAALASLFSVTFLVVDSFFSMNPFDELWWVLLTYLLVLLLRDERPRLWLLVGAVAGVGVLTKESMLFLGMALAAGLLLSPASRHLRTPWPWVATGIAALCVLPYLYWNYAHGWPTLQFWRSYRGDLLNAGPVAFLLQQIQTMNPWTLPLWLLGLYYFFFTADGRRYRLFGWAYVILFLTFVIIHAKPYFLAPAYPVLFAGGARWGEVITERAWRRWLRPVYLFALISTGLLLLPFGVPILPPDALGQLYGLARRDPAMEVESHDPAPLPQWFADRFGWEEMAAAVAQVVSALPPQERQAACVLAYNYGEAGALNFYAPAYGLPPVISGHDNYYLWGPGGCSGEVIVSVGLSQEQMEEGFGQVRRASAVGCTYCVPEENRAPILVARQPRRPLPDLWPMFKRFGM